LRSRRDRIKEDKKTAKAKLPFPFNIYMSTLFRIS
jgi:hypothetical protein